MSSASWVCENCRTTNPVTHGWCMKCKHVRTPDPNGIGLTVMVDGAVQLRSEDAGRYVTEITRDGQTLRTIVTHSGEWRVYVGPSGKPGRLIGDGLLKDAPAFGRIPRANKSPNRR